MKLLYLNNNVSLHDCVSFFQPVDCTLKGWNFLKVNVITINLTLKKENIKNTMQFETKEKSLTFLWLPVHIQCDLFRWNRWELISYPHQWSSSSLYLLKCSRFVPCIWTLPSTVSWILDWVSPFCWCSPLLGKLVSTLRLASTLQKAPVSLGKRVVLHSWDFSRQMVKFL